MKQTFIAISALVITTASQANTTHIHNFECPQNCPQEISAPSTTPASVGAPYKMSEVKEQAAEKTASVQFNRSMQKTLNAVSRIKFEEAIKDLEAANSFNNLMAQTLLVIGNEKLNDQLEDLAALERYEVLMATTLNNVASN
jgi:hypothetical protein